VVRAEAQMYKVWADRNKEGEAVKKAKKKTEFSCYKIEYKTDKKKLHSEFYELVRELKIRSELAKKLLCATQDEGHRKTLNGIAMVWQHSADLLQHAIEKAEADVGAWEAKFKEGKKHG
jgi:hypothetical protein